MILIRMPLPKVVDHSCFFVRFVHIFRIQIIFYCEVHLLLFDEYCLGTSPSAIIIYDFQVVFLSFRRLFASIQWSKVSYMMAICFELTIATKQLPNFAQHVRRMAYTMWMKKNNKYKGDTFCSHIQFSLIFFYMKRIKSIFYLFFYY